VPTVPKEDTARRPRVLVLGGGFGGIGVAQKLKKSDVDVVLVDKHDFHTFQPLLYQVATGLLEQAAVGHPIRDLLHKQDNIRFHQDRVTGIDLDAREVTFAELEPQGYDYLVLGLGAEVNFFGVEGAAELAFPLYTLPDAVRLKTHILAAWEDVDRRPNLAEDGALNVVVVGGGPTGVETAGALAELYSGVFRKDYPDISPEQARIVLVEAGPDIFPMFKENLRSYTVDALEKRGVEVMTGEVVESVAPTRVKLKSGTELQAHTLVWGAGLQGNALVRSLALELERGNRIGVDDELRIPAHPEVYAVGDIAAITDHKTSQVLPQLGSVALQSGEHAGKTIAMRAAGKETKPFKYRDKGTMAAIGRRAAVVQMLAGRTMKGTTAQLAWATVHLALLPTNEDRAKAVVDWGGAAMTHQRLARITVDTDEGPELVGAEEPTSKGKR
jgi:NADH dehydrogenase